MVVYSQVILNKDVSDLFYLIGFCHGAFGLKIQNVIYPATKEYRLIASNTHFKSQITQ